MHIELNHTIVWCRDKHKSSAFLVDLLGLPPPLPFGPMLIVKFGNSVSLDFYDQDEPIASQHYAFLTSEAHFDEVLGRVRARKMEYWAEPGLGKGRLGETYEHNGGRGVYFADLDGHLLEVMTRPYAIKG
ncbi:MAG: VOC family protein [Burkholderiales bacterium]